LALLRARASGRWWDISGDLGITLLVTREYEHLALSLGIERGRPKTRLLRLPHPSGIAADPARGEVHIACTRNPNAILTLRPAEGLEDREDVAAFDPGRPLMPALTRHLPGSVYLHDLAMIGGVLHANSVGSNAVVRVGREGGAAPAWWPACIDRPEGPAFGRNYLQLNSIAAGETLETSFFTASADRISARRPGHRNFPVDRRGVLFSGATREPAARGLTRPHSARVAGGAVWLDDSGYGTAGPVVDGRYEPAARLPGWTRGLAAAGPYLVVGTSRVIPRFRQYAPGLDVDRSACGLHLLHRASGEIHGSLTWSEGNQIFAIEALPASWTCGFPFAAPRARGAPSDRERLTFYAWRAGAPADPSCAINEDPSQ
ncbi:MAG: DUF4915 domain-containing protein, partial [Chloroflexota bacterium]